MQLFLPNEVKKAFWSFILLSLLSRTIFLSLFLSLALGPKFYPSLMIELSLFYLNYLISHFSKRKQFSFPPTLPCNWLLRGQQLDSTLGYTASQGCAEENELKWDSLVTEREVTEAGINLLPADQVALVVKNPPANAGDLRD